LQRAPLIEAQVEIEIAAGNVGRARLAADDLNRVATRFQSKALLAGATLARGRVRLAEGDAGDAQQLFSEALRIWNEVGAPYEAALARMGLADALRALGSEQQAAFEIQAAAAVLEGIESAGVGEPVAQAELPGQGEPAAETRLFRREGDYWSVVFEGRTVRVRDLKGIRYLAQLLAAPDREFHVLDLVAAESGAGGGRQDGRPAATGTWRRGGDPGRTGQGGLSAPPHRNRRRHRRGACARG
jgi:tetratricopeptide (TPR) repeat protein